MLRKDNCSLNVHFSVNYGFKLIWYVLPSHIFTENYFSILGNDFFVDYISTEYGQSSWNYDEFLVV